MASRPSSQIEEDFRSRSDSSRSKPLRTLHPAERKAMRNAVTTGSNKPPRGFDAFKRRLTRADLKSFRRAGRKIQNMSGKEIMNRFERHSTIHGICHAALAPTKGWRRFWLIVFAICFTILVFQVIFLIIKYLSYPKTVDLDLKFENAPFPSVTVCNLNPYKLSAISRDTSTKATMDIFEKILENVDNKESTEFTSSIGKSRGKRQLMDPNDARLQNYQRRYLQVYTQCYCEINRLSAERKRGSCFAVYNGKVTLVFDESHLLHNYHPTKCLCQLDWISKAIWPCFPYQTWKEHLCAECVERLGHCPMRFYNFRSHRSQKNKNKSLPGKPINRIEELEANNLDICLCHRDYNHCVANNENGQIPEIIPSTDLEMLNFTQSFVDGPNKLRQFQSNSPRFSALMGMREEMPSTTQAPEQAKAMGFRELKDEISIKTQAQENLMYTVEEKPLEERIKLSHAKSELILKCSFNQHDCDIEKDFKLHHDPTYGNCYTFNWNRTEAVTAHRAGANYGLRMMLYANISEYLPTSEGVGFRITVHDKWTVPFVDAFGHNAPTGFLASYGVRMKRFFRLEEPYGRCIEGGEKHDNYLYSGNNYSLEGCHRSCTQHEIIRECGCADPMYPVPNSSHPCTVSDANARECVRRKSLILAKQIANDSLANCNCHQPCTETGYKVTYSAARWPSGTTKLLECENGDDVCMEKYLKNAAMIQVFYEELNYETFIESPAYSITSLLAELGGITGLWIGISVVSILEVVQLIWFCMESYRKKLMHNVATSFFRSRTGTMNSQKTKSPSTMSLGKSSKRSSLLGDTEPIKLIAEEDEWDELESVYSDSTNSTRGTCPYVAPSVELPCTCLYGRRGNIVFMKPLCPFHGYMVRRKNEYKYRSKESVNDLTPEEQLAIEKEIDNEIKGLNEPPKKREKIRKFRIKLRK